MNFGYFAMLVSILIGAFILQITQIILIRSQKSVLNLGLYGILIVNFGKMGYTSIFDCFGLNFLMLFLVIIIYKISLKTLKGINF